MLFIFWEPLKQIQVLYLANGGIYQQHFGALGADIPFEAKQNWLVPSCPHPF